MIQIKASTISDAWFQLLYGLFDENGNYSKDVYVQHIQSGSFENEQYRIQYKGAAIEIEHPDKDIVPHIPTALGIPSPTTMDYIEDYWATYLMRGELEKNETYTYGSRINEGIKHKHLQEKMVTQLDVVIEMLKKTPLTNQAVLEIAKPNDLVTCIGNDGKLDPPCLRLIDFKVEPGKNEDPGLYLSCSVYFRSWDLWAGFPSNLGGIQLLKKYVADECGLIDGKMYAYSQGLHIYGYQEDIARIRTMKTQGAKNEG